MKKIDPEIRELAAIICATRANDWIASDYFVQPLLYEYPYFPRAAIDLASSAYCSGEVSREGDIRLSRAEEWAEAEALLRTGWTPS